MAYEIAAFCERVRPEAVWLEWNGTVPIEQLVRLLQDKRFEKLVSTRVYYFYDDTAELSLSFDVAGNGRVRTDVRSRKSCYICFVNSGI
mgnify:CR=1 FL=1